MTSAEPRAWRLRTTLTMLATGLALLILALSAALSSLTTLLHETGEMLGGAMQAARRAEQAEIGLLLHVRATDPIVRSELERDVRSDLTTIRKFARTERARALLVEAERRFEAYLRARAAGQPEPQVNAAMEATYAVLDHLVEIQGAEARTALERAADWDALADILGLSAIALLIAVLGGALYWLWARAFQPLFALAERMERFARGERAAPRLVPHGPEELRMMMERWNELNDALAAQREAQRALLAGVAHDLRSPLTALKLSVAAIRPDEPLPPEPRIRRTLNALERQLVRIERMLGDFLDLTRIEAGELELRRAPHDLRAVIEHVAELVEATPTRARLRIELPGTAVCVDCDAGRIEQAVSNLLSNAFKYSSHDSEVLVAVREEGEHAVIDVVDRGPGIPNDERANLWEAFRRGAGAGQRAPGLGLGLFMVRHIVESHHGEVELESERGKGSRFRIRLARIPDTHRQPADAPSVRAPLSPRATRH